MKEIGVLSSELMPVVIDQLQKRDVTLLVNGNSMLPFYKHKKTSVTLSKIDKITKYDVILYKYNNKYILHRIVKIKANLVTCRGDGLLTKEIINKEDIIAIVKYHKTKDKLIYENNAKYLLKVKLWHHFRIFRRVLLKFVRR